VAAQLEEGELAQFAEQTLQNGASSSLAMRSGEQV
jgi:hypothetical protein